MTDARYNLVFSGEIVPGADIAAVKQNLARLFKLDAAKVEGLFSGKPVVLKKDADQATAMKFRAALKQAGAQCKMEPVGDDPVRQEAQQEVPPAAQSNSPTPRAPQTKDSESVAASASESSRPAATTGSMDMVGTIRTGGTGFSGEFDVAPPGTDIADHVDGPAPFVPDVSSISMAEVGTDMGQIKKKEEVNVPDVSHLSVAPVSGND
ncbi:MAG: hypothetical protein P1U67_03480 [Alcanivoracaceae bacterium]|nr:hypothetical protein [Alcanivoracaceae bacterium]